MAWMMVHREGNFRRPNSKFSFNFKPGPVPQQHPADVVEYAVSKGLAERVPAPKRAKATAPKGGNRAE
ncbi:hypothetical protein GOD68_18290 [Sinorhizobium medicae]|nr:hypothetical protein [Sinorhizobium medicae]